MECVRSVFPDAVITPNCVRTYPIKVIIEAETGGSTIRVWEGRQQDLFQRNATRRSQAQDAIIQSLMTLKGNLKN